MISISSSKFNAFPRGVQSPVRGHFHGYAAAIQARECRFKNSNTSRNLSNCVEFADHALHLRFLYQTQRETDRAGTPSTSAPGCTSLVTTAPAPTTAPSPMVTPGRTIAPAPTYASSRTRTGASSRILAADADRDSPAWVWVSTTQRIEIVTRSPSSIRSARSRRTCRPT